MRGGAFLNYWGSVRSVNLDAGDENVSVLGGDGPRLTNASGTVQVPGDLAVVRELLRLRVRLNLPNLESGILPPSDDVAFGQVGDLGDGAVCHDLS